MTEKNANSQAMAQNRIKRLESRFFVGREREKELFADFLKQASDRSKIMNVYGTGGIGKSFLLDEYRRYAETFGIPFLLLDSGDFPHTPQGLSRKILSLLIESTGEETKASVEDCLNRLRLLTESQPLVIAIDTYEELSDLDWWLRESFLPNTSDGVLFVLSGRQPLQGNWIASPAWRSLITSVPVSAFDAAACDSYAALFGIAGEETLRRLHAFTLGHPLTLSLAVGLPLEELVAGDNHDRRDNLFRELTYRWLREVPDDTLRDLVEAAALVRSFNQELLEEMLHDPVSGDEFRKLTDLSFIRKGKTGYRVHALLRTALAKEIRARTPARFKQLRNGSIAYLHREIIHPNPYRDLTDTIPDLIYVLEDSVLLSTFLEDTPDAEYDYETVHEGNLAEAERYIEDVKRTEAGYERSYFHPQTGQMHRMEIPAQHDKSAFDHLEPARLISLGPDTIRMIKNPEGETVGLVVFIPIHRDSLAYLQSLPVSRHYFGTLDPNSLEQFRTPPDQPAGRFIYHLDLRKDASIAARAALMRLLVSLLVRPNLLIFSSPLPFHQEITRRMGFVQVEGATHDDFGPMAPSPTFQLDLRGARQQKYFDGWLQSAGLSAPPRFPEELFGLTAKEREVFQLILSTDSIAEIAENLNVTPVTIKKHLGRIYKKAGVTGKTQLLKMLLENQPH
ncbi:LuxR family transcriptional regulator [Cohnella mopanensis]|uniref:LuxR family transcriptional regulator n=1 Tax=Cohnella mopanensis TaxID=2911966 RepID=UPI001EF87586|nr:LuxR family transcriptional regulator [Cohnella mopanensis]